MPPHFAYDEQIASQPAAVADVLARVAPPQLDPARPVVFTGVGTSLHACRVAAAWVAELSEGAIRPSAVGAYDLATERTLRLGDQVVVVSHRGTKRFPGEVLARASEAGATTVLITGYGAPDPLPADHVLRTCPDERASTHTVSYTTALTALGLLVARMFGEAGRELLNALAGVPDALKRTLALPAPVGLVSRLEGRCPALFAGWGLDAVIADEAALKYLEGTYTWAVGMAVEEALHGPPAAFDSRMAAVILTPGLDEGGRTEELRAMLAELGAALLTWGDTGEDLRFAPVHRLARPLVSVVPVQRLVAEIARASDTNPDTTRADLEPWASAIARVRL